MQTYVKFLLLIIVCLLLTMPAGAESFTAKVVSIIDGSTFIIDHNGREVVVKLSETACPCDGQHFSNEAKAYTTELILNKEVWIDVKRTGLDKKLNAVVKCEGRDLNLELVRNGLAWYDYRLMKNRDLCDAEKEAREKKLGLWARANPTEPWNFKRSSSGIVPVGSTSTELKTKKTSAQSGSSGGYGFVAAVGKCETSFKISTVPNYNSNSSTGSGGSSGVTPSPQYTPRPQPTPRTSGSTVSISSNGSEIAVSSRGGGEKGNTAGTGQQGTEMCYVCMKQCPKDRLLWLNGINIYVCDKCIGQDIDNSGFVQLLYKKVRETMERDWSMTGAGIPNLDVAYLKKNVLGQYSIKWREIKIDRAQSIIITLAVIAHEFAHAWQQTNYPKIESLTYIEGFATWIQYKFVSYMGYSNAAEILVAVTPDLYRSGFRIFRDAERQYGFPAGMRDYLATLENEGK